MGLRYWGVVCVAFWATGCGAGASDPCAGKVVVQSAADVGKLGVCSGIEGDLWIESSSLTDLRGLEGLRSVRYLVVADNPRLESLAGLENLDAAAGISLWSNPSLKDVQSLSNVRVGALVVLDQDPANLQGLVARTSGPVVTEATCRRDRDPNRDEE
jgi:hypothetical protein